MKDYKRFKTLIVFILLLFTLADLFKFDSSSEDRHNLRDGIYWSYNQDCATLTLFTTEKAANLPDFDDPRTDLFSDNIPPWYYLKDSTEVIVIEDGISYIGNNAFCGFTSLTGIDFGKNVTVIGDNAFAECCQLRSINFPKATTKIGGFAFQNCRLLNKLDISDNITEIMPYAFCGCGEIESITVSSANSVYRSVGNCLINAKTGALILGCKNSVIPTDGSVTRIEPYSFYNCTGLTKIIIPHNNLETFSIGDSAFRGCLSLNEVTFYGNEEDWNYLLKLGISKNNEPLINAHCHIISFPDVRDYDWYSSAIQFVSTTGLMTGYQTGKFGLSDNLSRQDAAVILARMSKADLSKYTNTSSFRDVQKNSYYAASVSWGKENNIINGYTDGRFGVGDRITREQFLCLIYRYAKHIGTNIKQTLNYQYYSRIYSDFGSVSPFAVEAVCWALESGIISGRTSTTIAPQGYAQRCEIAKIFSNIFSNSIF